MEFERRIEQLEQEVEILKHQIQETLLDIQEKMLNRTHQSLRSNSQEAPEEDDFLSPSERPTQLSRPKGLPQPEPEQTRPQTPQPPPPPKPKNKVVSIAEFTGKPSSVPPVPDVAGMDWEELDRMEAWVLHKLKSMGVAKTRKLIRLHLTKGRLSKEMATALMQFVSLYDKQTVKPSPEAPEHPKKEEDEGEQNLILRLIAGVSNAGMNRNKGRKHG